MTQRIIYVRPHRRLLQNRTSTITAKQLLLSLSALLLFFLASSPQSLLSHHYASALTTHAQHHIITKPSCSPSSLPAHNTQTVDWTQYSLQQSYKKAGGILYKQSVLTPAEFTAVQRAIDGMDLQLSDEKESSFATNRMGAVIGRKSDMYDILSCGEGSLCRLVNALAANDERGDEELGKMILSPDIPIEIRIYEKSGAGMEWHVDDIIYQNTKQIEVVFTLENTSDCCTMWKPHDQPILDTTMQSQGESADNNKFRVESVQTTTNSAILIKAGSVEHKVSPLTYGRRVILKMAFVREDALMSDEMRSHVSHHNGGKSVGNSNKKKKRMGSSVVARKKKRQRR